jgi:ribosomal protein L30/L7E
MEQVNVDNNGPVSISIPNAESQIGTRSKRTLDQIRNQRRERHKSQSTQMIVIEQYRSSIRQTKVQKLQLQALGLGRIGKSNVVPNIPVFSKIVSRLAHVIRVKSTND